MTAREFGTLWTIYWSPLEYRDKFVVRRASVISSVGVTEGGKPEIVSSSLDEARSVIPQGRQRLDGWVDSRWIVEVWFTVS